MSWLNNVPVFDKTNIITKTFQELGYTCDIIQWRPFHYEYVVSKNGVQIKDDNICKLQDMKAMGISDLEIRDIIIELFSEKK
jgi:hypothetical protein